MKEVIDDVFFFFALSLYKDKEKEKKRTFGFATARGNQTSHTKIFFSEMEMSSLTALTALMRSSGLLSEADMVEIASLQTLAAASSPLQANIDRDVLPPSSTVAGPSPILGRVPTLFSSSTEATEECGMHAPQSDRHVADAESSLEALVQGVLSKPEETTDRFFALLSAIDRHAPVKRYTTVRADGGDPVVTEVEREDTDKPKTEIVIPSFDVAEAVKMLNQRSNGNSSDDDATVVSFLEALLNAAAKTTPPSNSAAAASHRRVITAGSSALKEGDEEDDLLVLPAEKPSVGNGGDSLQWIQSNVSAAADKQRLRSVQFDNFVIDEEEEEEEETTQRPPCEGVGSYGSSRGINTERPATEERETTQPAAAAAMNIADRSSSRSGSGNNPQEDVEKRTTDDCESADDEGEDEEGLILPDESTGLTGSTSRSPVRPSPSQALLLRQDKALLETLRTEVVEACDDTVETFELDGDYDYEANIRGISRRELE